MKSRHKHTQTRATTSNSTPRNSEASNGVFDNLQPDGGNRILTLVTITTGHTHTSPRHEIADADIANSGNWLSSAKRTTILSLDRDVLAAPVPSRPGFWGVITCAESCLLVTLMHDTIGPCVTFGVAPAQTEGEYLWTLLGSSEPQPLGPWCASKLEPWVTMCMIFNPEDVSWFIDFERSVAWAWLARLEREKVGDPAPAKGDRVSTSPISEGVIFDYDETGPRLRIFMPDPTEDEIRTVIQEACMFKLVTFGSVIFLLARFGDMKWMDAPYSIHLLRPEDRKLCAEFFDGRRYGLMVTLIDSNRNVQCGGRLVTWNPDFSGIFHHLVKRQLECQFSRLEHDETIRNIYATTTSANMASQAFAFTNGGD